MSPLGKRFGYLLNPLRPEDRGCKSKRKFKSKEDCEQSILASGKPFGFIELRPYKCTFCDGWHKTKHKLRDTLEGQ